MNKIWIQEGLDMRMVIFKCFSTGRGRGMVEMIPQADTLRKSRWSTASPDPSKTDRWPTGCRNTTPLTSSTTSSGHMFHIDFGKFLGHAQMFGNIKRSDLHHLFTSRGLPCLSE
ncbi:hypothetical protein F7725_016265 [Dissostichus mawsoni]|uniref:Uncharacterized protein n=1 Tax=Dissostichus mawsoni TaxID=36200 RepID=A0A7J5Z156_DISMA|nr:hypothetical protein F7725_016265 [Dissostichus mawsoni]